MNKGGTVEVAGIKVTMVGADHSAGDWNARRRDAALPRRAGRASSSRSRTASASITPATPTSSATCALIGELYKPDVAFLPIGGHFTMGPREAALAVELLGVQHVIPIHYGTFPLLAGTPDELRAALEARGLGEVQVHEPRAGRADRLTDPGRVRSRLRRRRTRRPATGWIRGTTDTPARS